MLSCKTNKLPSRHVQLFYEVAEAESIQILRVVPVHSFDEKISQVGLQRSIGGFELLFVLVYIAVLVETIYKGSTLCCFARVLGIFVQFCK